LVKRTFKGTIEYTAECREICLAEPIIFSVQHLSVERVCLESKEADIISLKFFIINEESLEKARDIAEHFLDRILNKIAFSFNAYVGIPRFSSGIIVEEIIAEDGTKSITVHPSPTTIGISTHGFFKTTPPAHRITDLLNDLPYEDDLLAHYYSQYRFVLLNTDPIAVFMAFYNILLDILGDQKGVDIFIRHHEPAVQEFPDRRYGKQTLYTKLRNDIAHAKKDRPLKQVSEEIKTILSKFKMLVRKAIEQEQHKHDKGN